MKILIVDDEKSLREMLTIFLEKTGHTTASAASFEEAKALASREEFDAILCDIKMPDGSGIDLLPHFRETQPNRPVLMITAHASHEDAVEAMRRGAADYIGKPFDLSELAVKLDKAVARRELEEENLYLKQELAARYAFANVIGKCSRMREIFRSIERIEKISSTVLITGESGTGKELIARAIHFSSSRKQGKFVSRRSPPTAIPFTPSSNAAAIRAHFCPAFKRPRATTWWRGRWVSSTSTTSWAMSAGAR